MKRSKEFQAESTGLMRRRRIAILFILITDIGIIADSDVAQDFSASSDNHIVADRRMTLACFLARTA